MLVAINIALTLKFVIDVNESIKELRHEIRIYKSLIDKEYKFK